MNKPDKNNLPEDFEFIEETDEVVCDMFRCCWSFYVQMLNHPEVIESHRLSDEGKEL